MALFHNRNYSARFEKEEMALFHNRVKEIRSMVMECISPFEIEKMGLSNLKECILSKTERICPNKAPINIQLETLDTWEKCPSEMTYDASEETCPSEMTYDASEDRFPGLFMGAFPKLFRNYNIHCENEKQETSNFMMSSIERARFDFGFFSRITWMDTPEFKALLKELGVETEEQLRERIKFTIYMLLLAILLGNNNECNFLAKPDRLNISCITEYLLGNDGAHSYNGNGNRLITRKYTRFTDEELDEIQPANIPLHVLQRQPTDKEIARLSGKIGHEYRQLGFELGLKPAQLDHLIMDYQFTACRIERMLFMWRDDIEDNATYEILVNAMIMHGINPDIVSQSLERA